MRVILASFTVILRTKVRSTGPLVVRKHVAKKYVGYTYGATCDVILEDYDGDELASLRPSC